MGVDEASEQVMKSNTGMASMQTANGIEALLQSLLSGASQVLVMEGELEHMQSFVSDEQAVTQILSKEAEFAHIDPELL